MDVPIPVLLRLLTATPMTLRLYTNTKKPEAVNRAADFEELVDPDYRPRTIRWRVQGNSADGAAETFTFGGLVDQIYGYVVTTDDGAVVSAGRILTPAGVAPQFLRPGDELIVTPRIRGKSGR